MSDIDLINMTTQELRSLHKKLQRELDKRTNLERRQLLKQFEKMAQDKGMSLSDLLDDKDTPSSSTPGKKQTRTRKAGAAKAPLPPMYRNPNDAEQTWSGRGRRPQWALDWMAAGRALEELKIAD